jgi:hypothetical protein
MIIDKSGSMVYFTFAARGHVKGFFRHFIPPKARNAMILSGPPSAAHTLRVFDSYGQDKMPDNIKPGSIVRTHE